MKNKTQKEREDYNNGFEVKLYDLIEEHCEERLCDLEINQLEDKILKQHKKSLSKQKEEVRREVLEEVRKGLKKHNKHTFWKARTKTNPLGESLCIPLSCIERILQSLTKTK